jgi:hypothetical protein
MGMHPIDLMALQASRPSPERAREHCTRRCGVTIRALTLVWLEQQRNLHVDAGDTRSFLVGSGRMSRKDGLSEGKAKPGTYHATQHSSSNIFPSNTLLRKNENGKKKEEEKDKAR